MLPSDRVSTHRFLAPRLLAGLLSCTTLLLLARSTARADARVEDLAPAQFLREYREAISNLRHTYRDVFIEGVWKVVVLRAKTTRFTYVSSGANRKLLLRREEPNYFDRAFVSTRERKYAVRRPSPTGAFFLEDLQDSDQRWDIVTDLGTRARRAAYCLGGIRAFAEFVNSPGFAVARVSRVTEAGATLLNVDFRFTPSNKRHPKLNGWFRVDPGLGWVIRSYDYELRNKILRGKKAGQERVFRSDGRVDYKSEGGKAVPVEIYTRMSREGKVIKEDQLSLSTFRFETTPSTAFALDRFGLGDLESTVQQLEARRSYWTSALALAAFLISFLLFRAGRSAQRRRAQEKTITVADDPTPEVSPRGQDT